MDPGLVGGMAVAAPRAVVVRRAQRPGFTLIELMVVLAVIGIAAAVSIPVVRQAVTDRRLHQSGVTFMNTIREARSRAAFRYAAQLVRVDVTGMPALQQIVEGDSSSCLLSNFPALNTLYTNLDLQQNPNIQVTNIRPGSASYLEFCFTPAGLMYYRTTAGGVFTNDNGATTGTPLNGGFEYSFADTNAPATVVRRVIVPLSGSPRFAQ